MDAGITAKAVDTALASQGLGYADLGGICTTHEHTDHIKCLHTLAGRRAGLWTGFCYEGHTGRNPCKDIRHVTAKF